MVNSNSIRDRITIRTSLRIETEDNQLIIMMIITITRIETLNLAQEVDRIEVIAMMIIKVEEAASQTIQITKMIIADLQMKTVKREIPESKVMIRMITIMKMITKMMEVARREEEAVEVASHLDQSLKIVFLMLLLIRAKKIKKETQMDPPFHMILTDLI